MRFLFLTPLEFVVMAAATASVVIVLYRLRLNRRRVTISSLMIWEQLIKQGSPRSPVRHWRHLLSLLLALLIALLMVFAFGDPRVGSVPKRSERTAIILDSSPSMLARVSDGSTRWERALQLATRILDGVDPSDEPLIATTSGKSFRLDGRNRHRLGTLLSTWGPSLGENRFPAVDSRYTRIYFISDGVGFSSIPREAKWISVFENAENVGITAFDVRPSPQNDLEWQAFLQIQNYSERRERVELTVSGGASTIDRILELEAGSILKLTLDLSKFEAGRVRAQLNNPNDVLTIDNEAFAYLPERQPVRVTLVTRGNHYLEELFDSDPAVELDVQNPESFRELPASDLYLFDRYAPSLRPTKPALLIHPPSAPWIRPWDGTIVDPEVDFWDRSHPVMRFVSLKDLDITLADRIDPGPTDIIVRSGDSALVVASAPRPRWIQIGFELSSSNFPLQLAFPMFLRNAIRWLMDRNSTIRATPGWIGVPLRNATITTYEGKDVRAYPQQSKTFFWAERPSVIITENRRARRVVAVNIGSGVILNINRQSLQGTQPSAVAAGRRKSRHPLWFFVLAASVLFLVGEWWTYHQKLTI